MAEKKASMRKPVFAKVDELRPGTNGHNLVVKVLSSKMVLQKGRPDGPQVHQMRIAECLVGDETGVILFTARNEQVETMKPETTVILRNAKINMFSILFCDLDRVLVEHIYEIWRLFYISIWSMVPIKG
ncbi:uncharacterized protein At4g28440-like isoform X2 [Salvia splendens]|uniref:uncharacterized protein At4g28440-like isoform X2 n=1 Tax=Salvia splendens TaxID=180675 RepID=UPI001C269810|nr:uncharacterized protein At4g28440-like isoform X2 [Salvia splendens]